MSLASHDWQLNAQVCLPRGLATVRGRVFTLYHPVTPPLEQVLREAKAYLMMREHFESMVVMIWVGQPFPPPSAEIRAAYSAAFAAGPTVEAVAWVIDSDRSLGASIVHSVSAQIFPRSADVRTFRDPFEAATWIHTFEGSDVDLILDGLDTLDRAHPA